MVDAGHLNPIVEALRAMLDEHGEGRIAARERLQSRLIDLLDRVPGAAVEVAAATVDGRELALRAAADAAEAIFLRVSEARGSEAGDAAALILASLSKQLTDVLVDDRAGQSNEGPLDAVVMKALDKLSKAYVGSIVGEEP